MGVGDVELTSEEVAAWVEASCAAQGVPAHVSDQTVLAAVVALIGGAAGGPAARQREDPSGAITAASTE